MAINRIDFQGAMMRTGDYSAIKAGEDNKPQVDQAAFQQQFSKEAIKRANSVRETDQSAKQESKFDAKDQGKNKYIDLKDKDKDKQKKQDKEKQDVDINMVPASPLSSFDLKI